MKVTLLVLLGLGLLPSRAATTTRRGSLYMGFNYLDSRLTRSLQTMLVHLIYLEPTSF